MLDLSPWDNWTPDGQPKPGTEEIVATLERALAAHPDHPGVCHFYIHTVEASLQPERAVACAERLPSLMPSFVFLVTLPIVDQDEALDLARRTAELVEDAR
jgi:hypothetical protein